MVRATCRASQCPASSGRTRPQKVISSDAITSKLELRHGAAFWDVTGAPNRTVALRRQIKLDTESASSGCPAAWRSNFQPNQGQIMSGSEVDTFETPKMHSQEVGRASRRYWEGLGLEAQGALSLKKK